MECPAYQVHLGCQVVTNGMAVTGRKVTKECQERLDPRVLLALLVQTVLKRSKVPRSIGGVWIKWNAG